MNKFIYPGSFDPVTLGHLDIIKRARGFCDELIVAVLVNNEKTVDFSTAERVEMIKECTKKIEGVEVVSFKGLLADFLKECNARAIIKGLRAVSDFEYELQMAHTNKKLNPEMETFFMMASVEYSFLSSSMIKDIARYGGDIDGLVPDEIAENVINKMKGKE